MPGGQTAKTLWTVPLLALLATLGCLFGGANDGFSGALLALGEWLCAALVFAGTPVPRAWWRRAAPVLALMAASLVWSLLPAGAALMPGVARVFALPPPLAPDIYPLALVEWGGGLALFLAAAMVGSRPRARERGLVWLAGCGLALILVTLALRSAHPAWLPRMEDPNQHRFAGTIGNPNAAGVVYAMLALLLSGLGFARYDRWRHTLSDTLLLQCVALALVVVVAVAMVGLTQSRTDLLLLSGMAALLILGRWVGGQRAWLGFAACLGLVPTALAMAPETLDRLGPVGGDALARGAIWRHYAALAWDAPWAGHGLGSFVTASQQGLAVDSAPLMWSFGAAHAAPLQVAMEMGWPGLALVAAAVAMVLAQTVAQLRQEAVGIALLLAVMLSLSASMVDIALYVPGIAALSLVAAGLGWGRALRVAAERGAVQADGLASSS